MADSTTTSNPKMSWWLKLLLLHSMLSQVIYRKTVQTAFVKGIETYLDMIAAHVGGEEQEARQRAIALFSGLVGAMMLSRAVKNSDPTLSDELLSSTRNTLKLKMVHA